jgi:hypothetical protein
VTAHWSCATGASTSFEIDGSRMVTADVFALTTSAETRAAARTPLPAFRSAFAPSIRR